MNYYDILGNMIICFLAKIRGGNQHYTRVCRLVTKYITKHHKSFKLQLTSLKPGLICYVYNLVLYRLNKCDVLCY